MNILRRTVMAIGGMTVVALVIVLAAPKAAHGIVATFVQVVNTPTNAIPAVQAPAASDLYVYTCNAAFDFSSFASCTFPAVPAGKTLIIEAVSFFSQTSPGADPNLAYIYAVDPIGDANIFIYIPLLAQPTGGDGLQLHHFVGTIGGRIYLKTAPTCSAALVVTSSFNGMLCTVSGYLVPAH
jgi:hypothetical protein